ncbi:hypothetical protein [Bosea thiooxidans]
MISRDWLQVKSELEELRSGGAERQGKRQADDKQPRRTQTISDDALMRHIADALRGSEIDPCRGDKRRS